MARARARAAAVTSCALVVGLLAAAPAPAASASPSGPPAPAAPSTSSSLPASSAASSRASLVGDPAVGAAALAAPVTVTVRFRHGSPRTTVGRLVATTRGRATRSIPALDAVSYAVPASQAAALVRSLRSRSDVVSAGLAVVRHLADVPNDSLWADQAATLTAGALPKAWDVTRGSAAVTIAVVDSGVLTTHPDLDGASPASKVVGRYNAVDGSSNVADALGHGTWVAGVAAARTNNGLGIAGVGRDTSLLAVKVANASGTIMSDAVANGIVWATDHGARIINLSLGSEVSDPTEAQAVKYAQSKNVLVVAAAGNDGAGANAVDFPAGYPGVVAVGAVDTSTGHRAVFSEHGGWITLAAPGVRLMATNVSGGYEPVSGTSFASPYVAGVAALLAAYHPSATAAELRSALVATAHGLVGEGLGAGQVDAAAALARFAPPTVPTLTAPTGAVSGTVDVTATSSAPRVRFAVDGVALAAPVAVVGGQASIAWSTFGRSGNRTLSAVDCNASGVCSSAADTSPVTVSNARPVVTSPAAGDALSGAYVVTATAPGGGVQFRVDGTVVAFVAAAPHTASVGVSLPDGAHTIVARQCDATGSVCQGADSLPISFTSRSLHPQIASVAPSPFSPNGDGRKDSATVTYTLPDREAVFARVYDAAGARVLGPLSFGTLAAGTHSFVVRGISRTGTRWPDGAYTVVLSTSATVGGVALSGAASRSLRVDTAPTALTRITGNGTGFYPFPDGYRDAFAPQFSTNEAANLSLVVRTTAGASVRTITVVKTGPGRYGIAWNGRNARGALVPAGWYRWRLQAVDRAGNVRVTPWSSVRVSLARLVTRTATLRLSGSRALDYGGSASCAGASRADSDFASGLWLYNECSAAATGTQTAAGYFAMPLPVATAYTSIFVRAYGRTSSAPTWLEARLRNSITGRYDRVGVRELTTASLARWSLGGLTATNHVSGRTANVSVIVPNSYGGTPPYDFDLSYVEIVVYYRTLA